MDVLDLSIEELHQKISQKEVSVNELVSLFLSQIDKEDKDINAFLKVFKDDAEKQAEAIDKKISKQQTISQIEGIPIAIKDNMLVKGKRCTAGSKILSNYIAPYDAFVIKRLKEKGAIIIGKTNMDEFAIGSSGEFSAFGPTKNPHNKERVPGGSSSGSAAAVGAKMVPIALGSDTGGSVRQPASFCGVVGLKPTYGAVSRYGLIAMSSSLDQIGCFGKNVKDTEIIFNIIKGRDEKDSTTVPLQDFSNQKKAKELKVGVPKEYFIKGIDTKVKQLIEEKIKALEKEGISFQELSLPHTDYALATYYIIMTAEVSSNLARYDGIKYGMSVSNFESQTSNSLLDVYLKTRQEYFGDEVKRRIMLGTYCLSAGYYEAYYLKAQKVRTKIKEDFQKAFEKVDVIITPTSPTVAFKLGEKLSNPLEMYLADILTASVNLAGLPAISIPCGKIDNLPVGIQFIAPPFREDLLFTIGKFAQKVWRYHL